MVAPTQKKPLSDYSDAAKRALREAKIRREKVVRKLTAKELYGVKGPEPTRFGDWEKYGIISDF
mgnify:CR=1 FL=1